MDTAIINKTVNAPLDGSLWLKADWRQAHRNVKRIQHRIVEAVKAQRWRTVRQLQRLLTRSLSAKLLAVKRVTENRGARTPGVDGAVWRTSAAKSKAVLSLQSKHYKAKPLKRILIPKAEQGKQRPLSIPTLKDRAMQALYKLGLEPITETQADKHSYGFRPGRSTADAIAQCFNVLAAPHRAEWVLEGDIQGCFDNIHHKWLLSHVPMNKRILKQWLKAGFMEANDWYPTRRGTPQGGIISPVLMNIALDGLCQCLHEEFGAPKSQKTRQYKVHPVRYADDFVITGISKALLEREVKRVVEQFLQTRGLTLSQEKTRVTSIYQGFDFLGQTIRKYRNKVLITPSKESQKAFRRSIKEKLVKLKTAPQTVVIKTLNPLIMGWGNYHRHVVSKQVFSQLDSWLWGKLWKWSYQRHPNKTKRWVARKYYHTILLSNWRFCTKNLPSAKIPRTILWKMASIPIHRHVKVRGDANPYDKACMRYFEQRQTKHLQQVVRKRNTLLLYKRQAGKCPMCQLNITLEDKWCVHHEPARAKRGTDATNLLLLHPHCRRQLKERLAAGWSFPDYLFCA